MPQPGVSIRLRAGIKLGALTVMVLATTLPNWTVQASVHRRHSARHAGTTAASVLSKKTSARSSRKTKTKIGRKKAGSKTHPKIGFKKMAPAEPEMPVGYQEKSKMLLQAYQLRKHAWNETVSKQYELAQRHLKQAIALTAQCYGDNCQQLVGLYLDLAYAAQSGSRPDVVSTALGSCLEIEPDCLTARLKLALSALKEGKTAAAISLAKQSVKSAPDDPRTHLLMSLLLARAGQASASRAEKNEAKRLYHSPTRIQLAPASAMQESMTTQQTQASTIQIPQAVKPALDAEQDEQELELP